ncbi:MAG TPA: CobD/CbiB family cobalamin biosynthesis protein, partial [Stellaceae bacterium]|nr:CobD/CbiB family cobalamin biosynthesis protein [Stellaceae bacterium]
MLLYATGLPDPLPLLLAALVLDLLLGELPAAFRWLPHPVTLAGRAIHWFDHHLNRERRDDATRRARGVLTVAALIVGAAALGTALTIVLHAVRLGWALEALLVAVLLAQRSLYDHVAAVRDALNRRGLAGGREAVAHIVGRDPESLDEHGVARAAIESLVENFSDGVVAPALYYALFGLPGIL